MRGLRARVERGEHVPGSGHGMPASDPIAVMKETIGRYTKPADFPAYLAGLRAQLDRLVAELRRLLGGGPAVEPAPRPATVIPLADRPRRARTVARDQRDGGVISE
jgi:hypothetical protein